MGKVLYDSISPTLVCIIIKETANVKTQGPTQLLFPDDAVAGTGPTAL